MSFVMAVLQCEKLSLNTMRTVMVLNMCFGPICIANRVG